MVIMYLSAGAFPSGPRRFGRSAASTNIAFAFVWLREVSRPSGPSVAYDVTIGRDWVTAAVRNQYVTHFEEFRNKPWDIRSQCALKTISF